MGSLINKLFALLLILILSPLLLLIAIVIFIDDGFPIIYVQKNFGKNHRHFNLYKFRTMRKNTPEIPTEELNESEKYLLKSGNFLRKFSLDELPQFYNVLEGKMKFIGPRPCMIRNEDIVKNLREEFGVDKMIPGITGWAQVNGRDLNNFEQKVKLDKYYMENKNLLLDIKIIFLTFYVVLFKKDNIKH